MLSATEIIIMVVAIVGGTLLVLAVAFGAVYGVSALGIKGLAGSRNEAARQKYPNARLLENASFFGQESHGVTQARGSGTLIITDTVIVFERWLPQRTYSIPLKSIEGIETPNSFLGKTQFTPLLKVVFRNENGQVDSMAWRVVDLERVKRELESAR